MRCLDGGEISRAATGGYHPHLGTCIPCCLRVEKERNLTTRLRALPAPSLSSARRLELRAELLAAAALAPERRSAWRVAGETAAGVGIAAAVAIALMWRGEPPAPVPVERAVVQPAPAIAPAPPAPVVVRERAAPANNAPKLAAEQAKPPPPPRVERQAPARSKSKVDVEPRPADASPHDAMVRFREGWLALRAGRGRDAIAHFDRVTDPVAREEALYWAVVAAHRTGDVAFAGERLAMFRAAFPKSEYLAQFDRAR